MSRRLTLPLLLVAASALLACSSTSKSGSAPTIKDFVLAPATLAAGAGKTAAITGSMTIEDVDGDIAGASGEVVFPDGVARPIQDVNLAAGNATSAPVAYTIPALPVDQAGDYIVSVQARDREGNQSPKASFKLTAQ